MTSMLPLCQNLQEQIESVLHLLHLEPSLRVNSDDVTAVQSSLRKAISPTFEIVFAGAFSAGKSMLINALLERELLYSAEGHATGTECYIAYAEPSHERVVLTFLSEAEIREQVVALCKLLGLAIANINQPDVIELLRQAAMAILQQEGGESKSERAKQAKALELLLEGFVANRDRIHTMSNATYSMEQFHFSNLKEAASYARRGSNSAVLKRIEYYCHHPLLQDGNVLIDTPGIDAPVKKDAELTYRKIEDPETSAVVSVLKAASAGDMTAEETELLEKMRSNPGIRDRVFYIFNRIDETWYNTQLRQRLDDLISSQFRDTPKVYKTSGLLGFYGSLIKGTSGSDRFGLDSLFAATVQGKAGGEDTPQFVNEFLRYCANSGKLSPSRFRISVNSYETPNENYTSNATAPLIAVLVEALYYLANELEDVLVEASQEVISSFFQRLIERVRRADYYSQVYRLLGNDGGIEQRLNLLKKQVAAALVSAARTECDRFVRESPRFYDEGTFSIYQFRQTLQQTSQGYDAESMIEAQPAIRQLLKLDFEPKVSQTIKRSFRQTINQTIKTLLLPMAAEQANTILQQYNQARTYLEQTLEKEAEEKIKSNHQLQDEIEQKIADYNQAVTGINRCLQAMLLNRHQLPVIGESDLTPSSVAVEFNGFDVSPTSTSVSDLFYEGDDMNAET